jgi:hypothetical protein
MADAYLIYDLITGETRSKKIRVPKKHISLGIYKQRAGVVVIGYFLNSPKTHGYGKDNYIVKTVSIPLNTKGGSARLKVGSRIISRAD